jgi:hypothetical protein
LGLVIFSKKVEYEGRAAKSRNCVCQCCVSVEYGAQGVDLFPDRCGRRVDLGGYSEDVWHGGRGNAL